MTELKLVQLSNGKTMTRSYNKNKYQVQTWSKKKSKKERNSLLQISHAPHFERE